MSARAAALLAGALLVGSLTLVYQQPAADVAPEEGEVLMRPAAAGATVGANSTNASASVAGSLLSATTSVLYLNNTNASGAWHARLALHSSSGVTNLALLSVGIDNGTAQVDQVTASLGSLTQSSGPYVRLEPGSTNLIFVTQQVSLVGPDATLGFDVYVSDSPSDAAYYVMKLALTVT